MIFETDKYFVSGSKDVTLHQHEGGYVWIFAQRELAKLKMNCSDCDYFEVGPKHGLHTLMMNEYEPKSITCVEAPNKLRTPKRFSEETSRWVPHIKTEKFELHYQDFDEYISQKKYDLLFYAGVMYHNINMIGQLQKLYELSKENAYMVFESSTTRTEEFMNKNVIEVHYPPYSPMYRDVQTNVFHPSKLACKSLLDMAGWEVLSTSDEHDDIAKPDRISILCKRSIPRKNRHLTDENLDE